VRQQLHACSEKQHAQGAGINIAIAVVYVTAIKHYQCTSVYLGIHTPLRAASLLQTQELRITSLSVCYVDHSCMPPRQWLPGCHQSLPFMCCWDGAAYGTEPA
jgi:hypothetical protein